MSDLISKTKVLEILQEKIEGFKREMNLYKDPRSIDNPPTGQFAESAVRHYYNLEHRIKEYQNLIKKINNIDND
jgi:hypothetical protein